MTQLAARFKQSPAETKRYVLDYTLQLATGENIVSIAIAVQHNSGPASPALSVTSLALLPANASGQIYGAAYFISTGANLGVYEVQFLATTSLGQILEDIVMYTLMEKL